MAIQSKKTGRINRFADTGLALAATIRENIT
jgi:hypothetical protein